MIITELNGGLGNQMFQYAVARRLAITHGTELKLDTSIFNTYKLRKYELNCFNICEDFVSDDIIAEFKNNSVFKRALLKMKTKLNLSKLIQISEKHFNFDKHILFLQDNVYLQGYWQSEKYFKDIEDIIRSDFTLKEKLSDESVKITDMINQSKVPISIHIRRGDYASDTTTNSTHGTCSLEYYQECVEKLAEKFSDLKLFIFSDDPVWVKANLHYKYPTVFVNHNGAEMAYEDMYLMSLCKHNIIANSSFSWWGAWLNNNPYKIILAPKQWFKKEDLNTKDLIPDNWIRI